VKNPELYRLFFEEASDALLTVNMADGRIVSANRAFQGLTGYSSEELEGESLSLLSPGFDESQSRERGLDKSILEIAGFYNDVSLSTRDGGLRIVSVKVRHVKLDSKHLALVVLSDDTERQLLVRDLATKHQSLELAYIELERVHSELKVSQSRMAQAAKLAALGELSAGLSHELNQPLTGIRGFAQEVADILKSEAKPSKKNITHLCGEIISNADKMAALLSHFRDFARSEKQEFKNQNLERAEAVNLNDVVSNVSRLLSRQLDKNDIELVAKIPDSFPMASGRALSFEQVLINLVTNSRDAILDKRRTHTGAKQTKGRILIHAEAAKAGWIELRVVDNGSGVPDTAKSRVFDPFFTTKEPGHGMGLGLSISFGIVHRFGGELRLESTSGSGSTFVMRVPMAEPQAKKAKAA
jgi:PAS domain S-box-containing protein